jgi:hypothetical protein
VSELPVSGEELVVDTAKCPVGSALHGLGGTVRLVVTDVHAGPIPSISATISETGESVMLPWDEIGLGLHP